MQRNYVTVSLCIFFNFPFLILTIINELILYMKQWYSLRSCVLSRIIQVVCAFWSLQTEPWKYWDPVFNICRLFYMSFIHHVGRNTVKIKTDRTDRLQSTQWFKLRILRILNIINRELCYFVIFDIFCKDSLSYFRHTHPFNGLLSRTTRVTRYQKG